MIYGYSVLQARQDIGKYAGKNKYSFKPLTGLSEPQYQMNNTRHTIDALIREGTNLKEKIGVIAQTLEYKANDPSESHLLIPEEEFPATRRLSNRIRFITSFPCRLEKSLQDIFSLVCSFDGVDHAGIYIFRKPRGRLDLVCHYNLPDKLLMKVVSFNHDFLQVQVPGDNLAVKQNIQAITLKAKNDYERLGVPNIVVIPLTHRGRVVGCLNLSSENKGSLSGFGRLVIEGLAERIARTIALCLAMARLNEAILELNGLMVHLKAKFPLANRNSEPLTGFFAGVKEEFDRLDNAIYLAADKIREKLMDGQRRRELPFRQKNVDSILYDINIILRVINRLRIFSRNQSAMIVLGMLQRDKTSKTDLVNSMAEFNHALQNLVMLEKTQETISPAFLQQEFKPLKRPLKLKDLKFNIERLTPN